MMAKQRKTPMAEHKHGEMNTDAQEKTFEGFVRFSVWGVVVSIGILLFLALVNS
jgi:hypothetical protein